MVSTDILSSTAVFNIDNNKKSAHYHVTLKTGVMAVWKFSFAITGINYILKYIKIENSYFKLQKYFTIDFIVFFNSDFFMHFLLSKRYFKNIKKS